MFKRKKCAGITAAALAAVLAFSGCGGEKKVIQKGNSDELSFSVYNPIFSKSPVGTQAQDKWQDMMEKYMGKKINISWVELPYGDYYTKNQVYVASGEYSDVFLTFGIDQIIKLGESKQILNLSDYSKNTPNYNTFLEAGQKKYVQNKKGDVFAFATASVGEQNGNQSVNTLRFDVFEKNNIPIPTNVEEYYQAAKKLKEIYPDSYPYTPMGGIDSILNTFLQINHTGRSLYYNGEKFVYPLANDEARVKEVVEYLKKMYDEKLLDPEFLTQSNDLLMQKMLSGKTFMVSGFMAIRINQYINNNKEYNVRWGIIPELKNFHNEVPWKHESCRSGKRLDAGSGIVINSKAKNPDELVKLIDYQYSDEMIELNNWGIEGVTFTKDADGNRKYTDEIINSENSQTKLAEYGVGASMSVRCGIQFMPQDFDSYLSLYKDVPVYKDGKEYADNWYHFTDTAWGKDSINPDSEKPSYSLESVEQYKYNSALESLNTYMDENISKFIIGQKSMSEWDSFVKGASAVADYNDIADKFNKAIVK